MVGLHHSKDMNLSTLQEIMKDKEAWHAAVHGVTKSDRTDNEQQQCTDCEYRLPTKGQRLLLSTTVVY